MPCDGEACAQLRAQQTVRQLRRNPLHGPAMRIEFDLHTLRLGLRGSGEEQQEPAGGAFLLAVLTATALVSRGSGPSSLSPDCPSRFHNHRSPSNEARNRRRVSSGPAASATS